MRKPTNPESGFTIIEMTVSLAVFAILLTSLFAVAVETSRFVSESDLDRMVQMEASQAFRRLSQELMKSGWNELAGVSYPRVVGAGSELEFRVLVDADGNGEAFDATTGELEWSSNVFSVRRDPAIKRLFIYDADVPVWSLGRFVESVSFSTYNEDSNLELQEIHVVIVTNKLARDGNPLTHTVSGSIRMRNATISSSQ